MAEIEVVINHNLGANIQTSIALNCRELADRRLKQRG
ncbi:hypothetical protein ACP4OV_002417 [Aristida adscensionis]